MQYILFVLYFIFILTYLEMYIDFNYRFALVCLIIIFWDVISCFVFISFLFILF